MILHRVKTTKWLAPASCFLIIHLLSASFRASEVSVEIANQGIRPEHVVLQAGDSVEFSSVVQKSRAQTLVIVDEANELKEEHPFGGGTWSYRFKEPGKFDYFLKEYPEIRGRAVVFSNGGSTSDLRHEMVSYSIGYDLGQNAATRLKNLDLELFMAGIEHAYRNEEAKLSSAEMDFIVKEYGREFARRARDERERIAARNLEESREFLELNARQSDVVVLPSGLQYKILNQGWGKKPTARTTVTVHHKAMFLDGTEFDNTHKTAPAEFRLTESVLPGYSEGLKLMSEGAKWQLFVPPRLAYGIHGQAALRPGAPEIEPNATLIFEVELLAVGEARRE